MSVARVKGSSSWVDLNGPTGSRGNAGPQGPRGPQGEAGGRVVLWETDEEPTSASAGDLWWSPSGVPTSMSTAVPLLVASTPNTNSGATPMIAWTEPVYRVGDIHVWWAWSPTEQTPLPVSGWTLVASGNPKDTSVGTYACYTATSTTAFFPNISSNPFTVTTNAQSSCQTWRNASGFGDPVVGYSTPAATRKVVLPIREPWTGPVAMGVMRVKDDGSRITYPSYTATVTGGSAVIAGGYKGSGTTPAAIHWVVMPSPGDRVTGCALTFDGQGTLVLGNVAVALPVLPAVG